ncbi:hypothetical protein [Pseudoclavibacter sp. VKM Ac-2888]|uniref:hypothetical protein n=1 Tax=Pseudoclavibacter sp. VKM Ac-2888 TaxID=2783830 RepID=UPI00188ABCBB|nr:hypothetical protein [Pseudoclavibacter sp. VKM Ac-2888]MBF4549225.1 hypothetical protein [Pseudoclavibacter sp. VKM Ac-2888]
MILIAEGEGVRPRSAGAAAVISLAQPANWVDFSDYTEVTFVLSVRAVHGNPTSMSMKPALMYCQANTGAPWDQGGAGAGWQYTKVRWFTVSDLNLDTDVIGGKAAWFPEITGPGTWKVTIKHFPTRLLIDLGEHVTSRLTFVGGTDPRVQISLVAYPKKG